MKFLSASFSPGSIRVPAHLIKNRRILISGAGGSIGSALARTIATLSPAQILLLESSEQALYRIDRELDAQHTPILANICDARGLEEAFDRHHPHIVFHAAAFKHVALMERHPFPALQNNTVGTFIVTQTAIRYHAEQTILVSTDKAVDPASIMGASKRLAELTALALRTPATKIKAVRLGNVYASQGSVVPLFEQQIAQGKPVTVTDSEATRYFLNLEQTAALLVFALSEEFPSAVLVPEMSHPIRIDDIARSLVQQSGSRSPITYTGLYPGEKLHEQLLSATESFLGEARSLLHAIRSEEISAADATALIGQLSVAIQSRDLNQLLKIITRFIPAYKPSETLLAEQALAECRA